MGPYKITKAQDNVRRAKRPSVEETAHSPSEGAVSPNPWRRGASWLTVAGDFVTEPSKLNRLKCANYHLKC